MAELSWCKLAAAVVGEVLLMIAMNTAAPEGLAVVRVELRVATEIVEKLAAVAAEHRQPEEQAVMASSAVLAEKTARQTRAVLEEMPVQVPEAPTEESGAHQVALTEVRCSLTMSIRAAAGVVAVGMAAAAAEPMQIVKVPVVVVVALALVIRFKPARVETREITAIAITQITPDMEALAARARKTAPQAIPAASC
jgi:hypothetical protein